MGNKMFDSLDKPNEMGEVRALIKKKKAGVLTEMETDRLIELLRKFSTDNSLDADTKIAAGVVLANLVGRSKPKQLAA